MPAASRQNVHAILGNDEGRVKEVAMGLATKYAPPDDEFGLEVISGQADNSDHASQIVGQTLQALQTLPFFGGGKVVWLQGANFFGDTVTGRSQTTLSAVEALQKELEVGLPPDVVFILSASEIDKRRSFYKKLSKLAKVEIYDRVDISKDGWENQLVGPVREWAREMGLEFEPDAVRRFVLMVGADTRQLRSELEKLALYLAERKRVTSDDVRSIVVSTHTGVIFEISNAIADRNLPLAMSLVEQQLKRGEQAVGLLLAAIVPKVRNLLYARDLIERHGIQPTGSFNSFSGAVGRLPKSETAHLPRKKDGTANVYGIFMAAQECRKFTAHELRLGLEACLEANLRLVTTGLDPKLVLSQLLARLLSPSPRGASRPRGAGGRTRAA